MQYYLMFFAILAVAAARNDCSCDIQCGSADTWGIYSSEINQTCSNCTAATCQWYAAAICAQNGLTPYENVYPTWPPYNYVSGWDCPHVLEWAVGTIVGVAFACLFAVICIPVAICFCCGMACFAAGRQQRTVTYVQVPNQPPQYQQPYQQPYQQAPPSYGQQGQGPKQYGTGSMA
eukprot:TRINITY_DN10840_c0_g1_i1.p3 TRINITY_DN10840_c0_g1~~TRINITY_DN10840_c0_g1_i1.p3  ORF type:complete len:176 (+),score=25.61 TRINITY_DN10840_c0_g1_i1:85-612(+)